MARSKNGNSERGQKNTETRKKVLCLHPRKSKPNLLARSWKWEDKV